MKEFIKRNRLSDLENQFMIIKKKKNRYREGDSKRLGLTYTYNVLSDNPKGPPDNTEKSTEHPERTDLGQTRKRTDTVLYVIESSSCKPETSTTAEINSSPKENKY